MTSRFLPACLLAATLCASSRTTAQNLPQGFVAEPIGSGWESPVGLCFVDAGRLLVAERAGRVWHVVDGQRQNLVLDLADETLTNGDRGLLGIAVPQDFYASGWLYLLFIVDNQGGDHAALSFARLIRVRTEFDAQGNLLVVPGSRVDLLGDQWSTGIPSCHLSHTIGSLHFLSDGSLVLTSGDNAHYDLTDAGGNDPRCFDPGRTPGDQDLGAFRSQYDDSLCGKVLRLDPVTGGGLPDNPFYSGNPDDLVSRVLARGLRNPFRSTLIPGTGPREALFIADVGWNTWEEINLCVGGENFGWPCYEGLNPQNDYQGADPAGFCSSVAASHTPPEIAWHHSQSGAVGFRGNCATGLCVYTGQSYPEIYRGRLFFFDYGRNWLRAARLDDQFHIQDSISVGSNMAGPVELVSQPGTGDLVYASLGNAGIFRLRYLGASLPPSAVVTAEPAWGPGDLLVQLSASGSSDPEGQALHYAWDLGDGTQLEGDDLTEVSHPYAGEASYTARVTVTDTEGLSDTAEVLITPNNTPPGPVALVAPLDGQTFESGQPLDLLARADDAEDGAGVGVHWVVDLVHDHHVHPNWASADGPQASVTPDAHGHGDNHYIVRLQATDSRGLLVEEQVEIYDAHSRPHPHLVEVPVERVRAGQLLKPVGHVDFSYGRTLQKKPDLIWDWGDGTRDVFADVESWEDTHPTHAYRVQGRYKLRLIADLDGQQEVEVLDLDVGAARPAVAVFAPMDVERWVEAAEQQEIVDTLQSALVRRAAEVRSFRLGQGQDLASWMDSLLDDGVVDVLVLLDFAPEAIVPDTYTGSLFERWVQHGNGIVWSGYTPLLSRLRDDGVVLLSSLGADEFFQAVAPFINQGGGPQTPTALGLEVLPSLPAFSSQRALRYDRLGPSWSVGRIFAEDGDADSDAIEVLHGPQGFYAQFLCTNLGTPPRALVLSEYLLDKLDRTRLGGAPPPAPLR